MNRNVICPGGAAMDEETIKKLLAEAERLRTEREKLKAAAEQVSRAVETQIEKLKLEQKRTERPKSGI